MLADEDELLHSVAILLVPVTTKARILLHEQLKLILWHGGIPLAGIADADLLAGLLEDVAGLLFVLEITDALGTDDALGPFAGDKFVEKSEIKGTTTVIDIGADAVFLSLTLIVVMVVMMVLMSVVMLMFIIVIIIVVVI